MGGSQAYRAHVPLKQDSPYAELMAQGTAVIARDEAGRRRSFDTGPQGSKDAAQAADTYADVRGQRGPAPGCVDTPSAAFPALHGNSTRLLSGKKQRVKSGILGEMVTNHEK